MNTWISLRFFVMLLAINNLPNNSVAQGIASYDESKRAFLVLLETADQVEVIDFRFVSGERSSSQTDLEIMSVMNGLGHKQSCRSHAEGEQYFAIICEYRTKFTSNSQLFEVGIAFDLPNLKVEYSENFGAFIFNCVEPDCISVITNLYSNTYIAARASTLKISIFNADYIRGFARAIQSLRQYQPLRCNPILSDC